MKKILILFIIMFSCSIYSDDRIIVSPEDKYRVIDIKYNEPIYFTANRGAIILLPNNQAIIMYNHLEVDEYKKIKEAAEFSGTFKANIGEVSDLTADAFIIKYNELGGRYILKEVTENGND